MQRAQLLLPPAQAQFLQDEAERQGVSMSELIRQWIAERMEAAGARASAADAGDGLIGLGAGGVDHVSERHDEVLAGARGARARVARQRAMGAGA
jgi:hypothetical protein